VPLYEKTQAQLEEMMPLLKGNFLIKSLSDDEVKKIAGAMKPESFKKDDTIIRYGDQGKEYYILARGCVKVILYNNGTDPKDPELEQKIMLTKEMKPGVGFGELALLYNDKRSASIVAQEDCQTYTLDGAIFKAMMVKASIQQRTMKAGFLDQMKIFTNLDRFQKLKLIDALTTKSYKDGEIIFNEGDEGKEFYIIEKGECDCLK